MTAESLDRENANIIANKLNSSQNNSHPKGFGPMRDVWNLSDFGFACTVTECIPARHLRIRALKKLFVMTGNEVVLKQINKYIKNDTEWDSKIADRLAFDLQDARKKLIAGAA